MHSDVFHVQSNLVTLISVPPQTSPTKSCNKHSCRISTNPQLCSPSHQNNNNNNNNNVINVSSSPITLSSVNNNIETQAGCLSTPVPTAAALQNQTLKQRINSLVMKTIADNTERDRSCVATALANNHPPGGDAWKVKVLQNTRVIVTVKESLQVSKTLWLLSVCDFTFKSMMCFIYLSTTHYRMKHAE
jgi:exonuclease 3'-5' domain-containing protein 1